MDACRIEMASHMVSAEGRLASPMNLQGDENLFYRYGVDDANLICSYEHMSEGSDNVGRRGRQRGRLVLPS
jgi:hypothetical protein